MEIISLIAWYSSKCLSFLTKLSSYELIYFITSNQFGSQLILIWTNITNGFLYKEKYTLFK
jgi:hypothetical protein